MIQSFDSWSNTISNDIQQFFKDLYSNLKDCAPYSKFNHDHNKFKNNLNTSFQMYLYDTLQREIHLYSEVDNSNRKYYDLPNQPFWNLLCKVESMKQNENIIEQLKHIRFYQKTSNDSNDVFLKMMNNTYEALSHYCELSKQYIKDIKNQGKMIKEYIIRYKNFTESALKMDDKYVNLNIIMNHLYPTNLNTKTPKYSLFRLFMLIWNDKCFNPLEKLFESNIQLLILSKIKRDISDIKERSQNIFSNSSMDCEDLPEYTLLSYFYSCINDTFCNEHNIFQISLPSIQTNSTFEAFNEIINQKIAFVIYSEIGNNSIQKNADLYQIVIEILSHFNVHSFFMRQFIPKLVKNILLTVKSSLKEAIIHCQEEIKDYRSIGSLSTASSFDHNSSHLSSKNTLIIEEIEKWFNEQEHKIICSEKNLMIKLKNDGLMLTKIGGEMNTLLN